MQFSGALPLQWELVLWLNWFTLIHVSTDTAGVSAELNSSDLSCQYKCTDSEIGGTCYCLEGKNIGPDNRTSIDRKECFKWGTCDQLCASTEDGYECSCALGYNLRDQYRCTAPNSTSMILYFAHNSAIYRMNPTLGEEVNLFANASDTSSIDFHFQKNLLYWPDVKTKKIHFQQLNDQLNHNGTRNEINITLLPETWSPIAIAVDWIGDKLYVADSVDKRIDVYELTGRWHTIVLTSNLTNLTDIALDPTVGYMFVAGTTEIQRANMDGTAVQAIVFEKAYLTSGLAVDIIAKRVFWCDSLFDYIETVNYRGEHRILIVRDKSILSPSRLALFETRIYWTTGMEQKIMSIDKYENITSVQSIYQVKDTPDIGELRAIKTVHSLSQPSVKNPCGNNNGGCQHMCIVTNIEFKLSFRCACNIGWLLESDQTHCNLADEFLLYSQKQGYIKGIALDSVSEGFSNVIPPIVFRQATLVGLDFDAMDEYIYSSDVKKNVIYRVRKNGTGKEIVLASQNEGVEGLSVDWASKNLYYIDRGERTLNVLSTRNLRYRRTLLKNLKRPRAIVVHPNKGFIFFSEWESPANISRVHTDGTNLTVFKNLTLGWPNGLSIDFEDERLYWCDAKLHHVQHSKLDGTDVKIIYSSLIKHPFGIAIYKNFMYLTDWKVNAIIKLHKLTGVQAEILVQMLKTDRFYSVKIYNENEQKIVKDQPCAINNGNCAKICFAIPTNGSTELKVKCDCPDGELLDMDDQITCQPDPDYNRPVERCSLDNQTCSDRNECLEWGFCDQLCTNTEYGYNCSCAPGYILQDGNRCAAPKTAEMMLIFAHNTVIYQMNPRGKEVHEIANTSKASGLDFHFKNNKLYWSDVKTKTIHTRQLNGPLNPEVTANKMNITFSDSWFPIAIAIDWISDKLYVVDSVGPKVDVFELTGRWHAIVLNSHLSNPKDIALDPTVGYMFIADATKVLRANMDGTNVQAIISQGVNETFGIAVDIASKRVYWCDSLLKHIQTVDYQGQHRFVVFGGESIPSPSKIALFENRVYWTDEREHEIMSVDKYNTTSIQSIYQITDSADLKAIKTVHNLSQLSVNNPCANNNGGCQHMCILTHLKSKVGFRCACNIGWRLEYDKNNCNKDMEFLLYSQQNFIKGKILNPVMEGFSDALLPVVSKRARFISVDFDSWDEHIYYSDVLQNLIYRMHNNGTSREIVLASQNKGVEGLAVDWASKNLYYIDGREKTLNVLSTRNVTYRRTLLKNLKRPRAIVVHPNKGFIFFSEWESPANISRAHTDGTNLIVFTNLTLGWPNGLSIDFESDRLYWCDALTKHVQHSTLDGTNVQTIISSSISHPFSIVIHKSHMFISDWKLGAITKFHKLTGIQEEIIVRQPLSDRLNAVKIYSKNEQNIIDGHPCKSNNGGCSKICFPIPKNGAIGELIAKCDCPYGERLGVDQITCQADPIHEPPIQPCKSWEFACNNDRCILNTWVCDGEDDCLDNSDEERCN